MGHEFTGEVVEAGSDDGEFAAGTNVVVNPMVPCGSCTMCKRGLENLCLNSSLIGAHRPGAFAEWVVVPEKAAFSIPETLDSVSGSLVEPLACGLRAARLAGVQVGDAVAVFGAGIIGLMSLVMAKRSGARTLAVIDTNDRRLEIARAWGATHTFSPKNDDIIGSIKLLVDGVGVDCAIDAVGAPVTRHQSAMVVRPSGHTVFVGLHDDDTQLQGNHIVRKEIHITGSFCYSHQDFQDAIQLVVDGFVRPATEWLDERPLDAGKASFDEQIDGPALYPKIVLRP
jgi:threonine dehydrogenase-like Zn-dependent dehydrogenase